MAAAEMESLVKVSASVSVLMAYARFAAGKLPPGRRRLLALLPATATLLFLPLFFSSTHLRAISGFFLAWLAAFKLLLLSSAAGPLSPSLPFTTFLSLASLPVNIRPPLLLRRPQTPPSPPFRRQSHHLISPTLHLPPPPQIPPPLPLRPLLRQHLPRPRAHPLRRRVTRQLPPRPRHRAPVQCPLPIHLLAGLLGAAVESHGHGHPSPLRLRPHERAVGRRCRRYGVISRLRRYARAHVLLHHIAAAHGGGALLLFTTWSVHGGGGVGEESDWRRRRAAGESGVGGGDDARVCVGDGGLAVLSADREERIGRAGSRGVGSGGAVSGGWNPGDFGPARVVDKPDRTGGLVMGKIAFSRQD